MHLNTFFKCWFGFEYYCVSLGQGNAVFLDVLDLYKCFPSLDLYMLVFHNVCSSVMLGFTFFNLFSHPFTLPLTSSVLFLPSISLPFPTQSLNSFTLALLEPFTFHFPSLPFTTLHFSSFTSLPSLLFFTSLPSPPFTSLYFPFSSTHFH